MRYGAASLVGLIGLLAVLLRTAAGGAQPSSFDRPSIGPALLSPVQGTEGVRDAYDARVRQALERALDAYGIVASPDLASGRRVVGCGTPECVERVLDEAGVSHALVPAVWTRSHGRRELTLTLVGKSGRNLNAGTVLNGDLSRQTEALVHALFAKRRDGGVLDPVSAGSSVEDPNRELTGLGYQRVAAPRVASDGGRNGIWMAGPIVLWIGGAATVVAVGVSAAMRDETQTINGGALAGWILLGGSAIAGGSAWWVVGRRKRGPGTAETAVHVSPRGFDLRVRF